MAAEQGVTQKVGGAGSRAVKFLREVRAELKKVIWPGRRQTVTYTLVVVAAVVIMLFFIWGVDIVFTKLLDLVIK